VPYALAGTRDQVRTDPPLIPGSLKALPTTFRCAEIIPKRVLGRPVFAAVLEEGGLMLDQPSAAGTGSSNNVGGGSSSGPPNDGFLESGSSGVSDGGSSVRPENDVAVTGHRCVHHYVGPNARRRTDVGKRND
jgi:hypothetical protein